MTNKTLYKGIVHSDKFIHNHINELLNHFNGSIVKILSNAKVTKYAYNNGVKTNNIIGYDEEELKRNAHGCANILVKKNCGSYWDSTYYYVSSSVIYEEDTTSSFFNVPIDLIEVTEKFKENKFLVYSKLDEKWFSFSYREVYDDYVANSNNGKRFYNYNGYQYFKYEMDLSKGFTMDKKEHCNAHYFENVHVGVTRYSKTIAGTHCFVRVFSKATGKPTTKYATEFKSLSQAFEMLNKWKVLDGISKKTFIRKVYKNELFETPDFYFQCATDPEVLLKTMEVIKEVETDYFGIVEAFKSFGEVIEDADIEMAKQKHMTVEEFNLYCLEKYNSNWNEDNLLMTEAVLPEDIENINTESYEKSESWYRNNSYTDDTYFEKEE